MASLFDTLQAGASRSQVQLRTDDAKKWFRRNVAKLGKVSPQRVLKDDALDKATVAELGKPTAIGSMYMYFYNPKHKATLPYYDRFPLTIVVGEAPGGFYGLNLHYLSPVIRAKFLDELMKLSPTKKMDDTTRLKRLRSKATKNLLMSAKRFRYFEPCWKHYLMPHVKTNLVRVPMTDWEIAIFLPTEQFKKVSKETVWRYSRKTYASGVN
jgi:hypothetical protein